MAKKKIPIIVREKEKPKPMIRSSRDVDPLPAKLGNLSLKRMEGNNYDVILDKVIVGNITGPRLSGIYYIPTWGVFKEVTLLECFGSQKSLLDFVSRTFDRKKSKKK